MSTLTNRPDQQREVPRRRVVILEVDQTKGLAVCWDSQSGQFNVDLTMCLGTMLVWPSRGEEWYVIKISDVWRLERRTASNNAAIKQPADVGDWVLYNPNGKIILRDKNGMVGGVSGVKFGSPVNRRIEPGTTYKSVQVTDAATGEILGYMPLYQ